MLQQPADPVFLTSAAPPWPHKFCLKRQRRKTDLFKRRGDNERQRHVKTNQEREEKCVKREKERRFVERQ